MKLQRYNFFLNGANPLLFSKKIVQKIVKNRNWEYVNFQSAKNKQLRIFGNERNFGNIQRKFEKKQRKQKK